jgi:hypothetical protein
MGRGVERLGLARGAPRTFLLSTTFDSELRPRTLKRWQWLHTWTNLGCTVFLPALCLTACH